MESFGRQALIDTGGNYIQADRPADLTHRDEQNSRC